MIIDHLGLSATHLINREGVFLHIPYRLAAHGLVMVSPDRKAAVVIAPACAIEDPRLAQWLSLTGIYRIEDPSGSVARIGEGRVIDRLRRHRAAPVVLPARIVAAFSAEGEWLVHERRYLENAFAQAWIDEGNTLASMTFDRHSHIYLEPSRRIQLMQVLHRVLELIRLGEAVLDGDADFVPLPPHATEWPLPPTALRGPADEVVGPALLIGLAREPVSFRRFEVGTRLRYEDGRVSALATVRDGLVVLHTNSSVHVQPSASVGQRYRRQHAAFLQAARVMGNADIGITRVPVAGRTAASLMKLVTAGRAHVASRWRTC